MSIDPYERMILWADELPDQIGGALARAEETGWPTPRPSRDGGGAIFLGGMGGSASACKLARLLAQPRLTEPCQIDTDPSLPAWVGPETTVGIVSYSGNTWESIALYEQACRRGCRPFVVTSGGTLERLCLESGGSAQLFRVPAGYEPRAALGWMMTPVALKIAGSRPAEIVSSLRNAADAVAAEIRGWRDGRSAPGRDPFWIAQQLQEHTPFVYAESLHDLPVAGRWKTQLLENAEQMAHCGAFPELNHNEIMGWSSAQGACRPLFILLEEGTELEAAPGVDRTRRWSIEAALAELDAVGARRLQVPPLDPELGIRTLANVALGDRASVELARLRGVDPIKVEAILRLKAAIERRSGSSGRTS